jgi:aryl-alcohol dehydrogenase-like predicted oxidoreductase
LSSDKHNRLGNSGLYISKVILGGASFGDVRYQPWLLDENDALPLLEYAWKKGINTWDTVSKAYNLPHNRFNYPLDRKEEEWMKILSPVV